MHVHISHKITMNTRHHFNFYSFNFTNLNRSIWVGQCFSEIVILDVGPFILYYDLAGPFLQSTFRQYFLGCGSDRLCLENSLRGKVIPGVHPGMIVGVFSRIIIFYFIIWLLEDSLRSQQPSLTIISSTWCHTKGGSCFYFVTWCASIDVKGWCMENSMWNWLSTLVLCGWSSPFFN